MPKEEKFWTKVSSITSLKSMTITTTRSVRCFEPPVPSVFSFLRERSETPDRPGGQTRRSVANFVRSAATKGTKSACADWGWPMQRYFVPFAAAITGHCRSYRTLSHTIICPQLLMSTWDAQAGPCARNTKNIFHKAPRISSATRNALQR